MIPCPAPVERDVANRYCGADVHGLGVDALNLWQKYRVERTLSCPLFVAPSPKCLPRLLPQAQDAGCGNLLQRWRTWASLLMAQRSHWLIFRTVYSMKFGVCVYVCVFSS